MDNLKRPHEHQLTGHPDVEMDDLIRATNLTVICEGEFHDPEGAKFYLYTVAGELDGNRIEQLDHVNKCILGATVGGDAIFVQGKDRKEADWIAANGLMDSLDAMRDLAKAGLLDPGENSGIITDTQVRPMAS